MALIRYLFDGVDGTDMTTANSGASVISLNGGTAKFSAVTKQSGVTGGRWVATSAGACLSRFMADAPNNNMAFEGVVTFPSSLPAANSAVFNLRHAAGSILQLYLSTSGKCGIYVFGGATAYYITTDGSTSIPNEVPITLGGQYRVSIVASGGSTTNGSFTVKLYTPTGITPLGFQTRTNQNMSANPITGVDVFATAGDGNAVGWDDIQINDGGTAEIGQYAAGNNPPVASAGPDQVVQSFAAVTLAGTGTDSDGTITSGLWSQVGGVAVSLGGSGLTRTFTSPASANGETLMFSLIVTDNDGNSSAADTMTVTVLPHLEWRKTAGALVPIRRSA